MTDNAPVRRPVNKTENRYTFKIKKYYYLELLSSGMMNLPGSTEKKILKIEMVKTFLI